MSIKSITDFIMGLLGILSPTKTWTSKPYRAGFSIYLYQKNWRKTGTFRKLLGRTK